MPISRRDFIQSAGAGLMWPLPAWQRSGTDEASLFQHGVASGDPLADRVMLWTRATMPPTRSAIGPVQLEWVVAADESLTRVVRRGQVAAGPERDFTAKVDVGGLEPARTYYYAFRLGGQQSAVGRTRTLPLGSTSRLRIAVASCSNYPAGFFNAYRCIANRDALDLVLHLGDYIYEYANGEYGNGWAIGRVPKPETEAITLADYRLRYATYRSDVDLQEVHRQHPFVVVWDDHELANNASRTGAQNHSASEGSWNTRRAAAYRAYCEWMPIRETPGRDVRLYRSFRVGDLADIVMLDTRGLRDPQVDGGDAAALAHPARTVLGRTQEAWLHDELRASQRRGVAWRLIGQQIMFSRLTVPGATLQNTDTWEGYPSERERLLDVLTSGGVRDLAILTGDIHSSWALDVPRDPWHGYNARTGAASLAVELVTPAISSPPLFSDRARAMADERLRAQRPHLKVMEGSSNGYMVVDITPTHLTTDWYYVPTVYERVARESRGPAVVCERGSSRLLPA